MAFLSTFNRLMWLSILSNRYRAHHYTGPTKKLRFYYTSNTDQTLDCFELDQNDDGPLDNFTSRLIQSKASKWEAKSKKTSSFLNQKHPRSTSTDLVKNNSEILENFENLDSHTITKNFRDLLDQDSHQEILCLTKKCIKHRKCPDLLVLIPLMSVLSQMGQKDIILALKQLFEVFDPEVLKINSNFDHFLAEAVWIKGDITQSVQLFEHVYQQNPYLRRRIRLMLKNLIANLTVEKSQAALVTALKFCEKLARDFQDFYPLVCLWQSCFLSEWFADQCTALDMLEKHQELFRLITDRIQYVVVLSLKCHRTEVVYRLLEILLKYDMKEHCSRLLATLLDYQFRHGNFQTCSEIIHWAMANQVDLPKNHNIKLINILLNGKLNTPMAQLKPRAPSVGLSRINLKF